MPEVYDDHDTELRELEDSYNAPSAEVSGSDIAREKAELEDKYNAPSAPDPSNSGRDSVLRDGAQKFVDNKELDEAETAAVKNRLGLERASGAPQIKDQLNRGYTGNKDEKTKTSNLFHSSSGLKKKIAIAGAVAGTSVIGSVMVFLLLLPLKIEHVIENLEQHYGSTSSIAVDEETDNMYSSYMDKYVLPGLFKPGCTSTATDKNCVVLTGCGNSNPVCRIYQVWKDNRAEQKLAAHGLTFGNSHGRIYMQVNGLPSEEGLPDDSIDVTNIAKGESETNLFDLGPVKRSEARQAVNEAFQEDGIIARFRIGKFLEAKYGIERCVIACNIRDDFHDAVAAKKQALLAYTIEHVIQPTMPATAEAIQCLLNPTCNPDQTVGDGEPTPEDPTNGELNTVAGSEVQSAVDEAAAAEGSTTLDSIISSQIGDLNEAGGWTGYVVDKVVSALGISAFSSEAMQKAIPIIGWINMAAMMAGTAATIGPKIVSFGSNIKSAQMAADFAMYQTVGAESTTGHMDATELGSFSDGLSNGTDMTKASLYQNVVNNETSVKPVVPAEYSLDSATSTQAAVESVSKAVPPPVAGVAQLWNKIPGKYLNSVTGFACDIPGLSAICSVFGNLIGSAFKPIFTWLATSLFPTVVQVGPKVLGSTAIIPIIGGADVSYNAYAHNSLGGQLLSPQQVSVIQNQNLSQQKAQFDSLSTFARIFNTSSQYSLVSRLAMDMPTNMLTATNDALATVLTNPVTRLSSVFSSLVTKDNVFAAETAQPDPFDIDQYGYLSSDKVFSTDPAAEWNELDCSNTGPDGPTTIWNKSATEDKGTGQLVNTTTDPCLLIQAAIQGGGGISDNSLAGTD